MVLSIRWCTFAVGGSCDGCGNPDNSRSYFIISCVRVFAMVVYLFFCSWLSGKLSCSCMSTVNLQAKSSLSWIRSRQQQQLCQQVWLINFLLYLAWKEIVFAWVQIFPSRWDPASTSAWEDLSSRQPRYVRTLDTQRDHFSQKQWIFQYLVCYKAIML